MKKGFSLLELSISIVIVSLLMAGAFAGVNIIEKAKLQMSIKQIKELEISILNFKERYLQLPGDFNDAYNYFYNATLCPVQNYCNGDGDGIIEIGSKQDSESYRSYQHLELSEMIKGSFSGIWGEETYLLKSPLGANITINYDNEIKENILKLGEMKSIAGQTSDRAAFSPELAKEIDQKIDDGSSYKGQVRAINGFDEKGVIQECYKELKYNLSNKVKSCVLGFIIK